MTDSTKFMKLLEPSNIGPIKTRNRMIKTSSSLGFTDEDGYVSEAYKAYYEALARGGVGLIIIESTIIDYPLGKFNFLALRIDDDKFIPGMRELTDVIHKHKCPVMLQLAHSGPWYRQTKFFGFKAEVEGPDLMPVAASAVPELAKMEGSRGLRALTIPEIQIMVDKFASAAVRAQKAGFDGVELNFNSSHLVNTFLSRAFNKREDIYGSQNIENRTRFGVEIIKETRKRTGSNFAITVLMTGVEPGLEEGTTLSEAQDIARAFEAAGVDALNVRPYLHTYFPDGLPERIFYPERWEPFPKELDGSRHGVGAWVPPATNIKQAVKIPVICVGRLDAETGEQILRDGRADFIGLTRRLYADPELPNKVMAGKLNEIAPCTACMHCISCLRSRKPVHCRINANLGSGQNYTLTMAKKKKKVLVIGSGPSGMESARVASLRGHDVTLLSKDKNLGGLLPLAAVVKGWEIENLQTIIDYYKTVLPLAGVKTIMGKEFNQSIVDDLKPDVIIVAVGGISAVPDIPGIDRANVVKSSDLHGKLKTALATFSSAQLHRLTKYWMPVGKTVIVIGGDIHGCQLAEFLVKRGRKVTIVERSDEIGEGIPPMMKYWVLKWMAEKGVLSFTGVKYNEITPEGVIVTHKDGNQQTLKAKSVIYVAPLLPNDILIKSLQGKAKEIYAVGDCKQHGFIVDAVAAGSEIGKAI